MDRKTTKPVERTKPELVKYNVAKLPARLTNALVVYGD